MTYDSEPAIFSDDPNPQAAPGLGRGPFISKALATITVAGRSESSTVFGLIGPWGSGKTSILEHLREKVIAGPSTWTAVQFNPWTYADMPSLQKGFFTEVLASFEPKSDVAKLRDKIASFGDAVAPLASVGSLAGLDGSTAVAGAARLIAGDQSVSAARKKLEAALAKHKTPILIIVDDLDRLAPDELLLTLKLVRLIGRLPYVHYLLAYDEKTLLDVLGRTGLVGSGSVARARDYLEKVIQVRLDVPDLRPSDALKLTNVGIDEALAGTSLSSDELQRFSRAYFDHMSSRMSTPRAIKRYFGQAKMFVAGLPTEVDLGDFLILTWLRTSEPGVYSLIQRRRDDLLSSTVNAKSEALAARAMMWREEMLSTGTREGDIEGVASLIGSLFPSFASAWSGRGRANDAKGRRISNSDYFDRYFSFGIAEGDIADATVVQGMIDIVNGIDSSASVRMTLALIDSPDLLISKLASAVEETQTASKSLLVWLASGFEEVPKAGGLISPQERVTALAARIMRRLSETELLESVQAMSIIGDSGMALAVRGIDWASSERVDEPPVPWSPMSDVARVEIGQLIFNRASQSITLGPEDYPASLWSLLWPWSIIHETSAREFVGAARAQWGSLETVAHFIGTATLMGVPGAQPRLRDIDFDLVGRLLNLDEVQAELAPLVDEAPIASGHYYERPDTAQARREFALTLLRMQKERNNPTQSQGDVD